MPLWLSRGGSPSLHVSRVLLSRAHDLRMIARTSARGERVQSGGGGDHRSSRGSENQVCRQAGHRADRRRDGRRPGVCVCKPSPLCGTLQSCVPPVRRVCGTLSERARPSSFATAATLPRLRPHSCTARARACCGRQSRVCEGAPRSSVTPLCGAWQPFAIILRAKVSRQPDPNARPLPTADPAQRDCTFGTHSHRQTRMWMRPVE